MSGGNGNPPPAIGRPVIITLTVSAKGLSDIPPPPTIPSSAVIDEYCTIFDDTPGRPPYTGPREDFSSDVYIGNRVTWKGVTKFPNGVDSGYSIAMHSIVYEPKASDPNDVSFFPSPLAGQPGRTGDATTLINDDTALVGKHDIYTINFYIYAPGNNTPFGPYPIDPKLQGNS